MYILDRIYLNHQTDSCCSRSLCQEAGERVQYWRGGGLWSNNTHTCTPYIQIIYAGLFCVPIILTGSVGEKTRKYIPSHY